MQVNHGASRTAGLDSPRKEARVSNMSSLRASLDQGVQSLLRSVMPRADLDHIPGAYGLPVVGCTFPVVHDFLAFADRMYKQHGEIIKGRAFFNSAIGLVGPDANQFVLQDRGQVFSNGLGYGPFLERLFGGGLMLRDFEEHRQHRSIMQAAFKKTYLAQYCEMMLPNIQSTVSQWGARKPFIVYPNMQRLTLDLAAHVFAGEPAGARADRLALAFGRLAKAISALVRIPIPGLKLGNAVRDRRLLAEYFGQRISQRRVGSGMDLFSRLCQARSEEGATFTDDDVVDHMLFLIFAAHDTTSCAVTGTLYGITQRPEWQERIREEARAIGDRDHKLTYEELERMPVTEFALKEGLRLYPSVPVYMRKTVAPTEYKGYAIPAHTPVFISSAYTHRMSEWWSQPDEFDPGRFAPERAEHKRHPYQWIPFGGGARLCIGMPFTFMQVKAILFHLLTRYRLRFEPGYQVKYEMIPLPKPKDGLRIVLEPL
jgi:cytochrome P450